MPVREYMPEAAVLYAVLPWGPLPFFFFLANAVQIGIKVIGKQVLFGLFRPLERVDFGSS